MTNMRAFVSEVIDFVYTTGHNSDMIDLNF